MGNLRERAAELSRQHPWISVALAFAYILPAAPLALMVAYRVGDNDLAGGGVVAMAAVVAVYVALRVAVHAWLRENRSRQLYRPRRWGTRGRRAAE